MNEIDISNNEWIIVIYTELGKPSSFEMGVAQCIFIIPHIGLQKEIISVT